MRIRVFLAAVLATLALSAPVRAAATPEPLPPQVEAHVALRSPIELLGNIDGYVAAASKGTKHAIPPGFLSMMAQMYMPIPLDTWGSDADVHVLILRTKAPANPRDIDFVVVFGVPDFAAFLDSMGSRDWLVGEPADKGGFKEVRPIVAPTGKAVVVADLGDGRAAFAREVSSISRGLDGWKPSLSSDADIVANFAMGGDGVRLREKLYDMLNDEKDEIVDNITDAGFKPETAKNLIATVEKVLPLVVDELSGMRSLVMELGFDGPTLTFDFGGKSSAGTMLGEIAEALSSRRAVDLSIGESIPAGAVSVGVSGSPDDLIPNAKNRLVKLASSVYGGVMPEFRDEIVDLTGRFMDCGLGQTAIGSYIDGIDQYRVSLNMTKDPESALTAFTDLFELCNKIWTASIDDPGYGLKFAGAMRGVGDVMYYRYQIEFTDEAKFQSLLDRIMESRDGIDLDVGMLKNQRFFFAGLEDGIVSASGELTDERFLALLEEVKKPSGDALIASDAAKALLKGMPNRQASVGILEAAGIFHMYSSQLARNAAGSSTPEELAKVDAALKQIHAGGKSGENLIGFALGAEKGWLNSRFLVPAEAVSRILRDVEKYDRLGTRSGGAVPDPVEEPDEYEDDLEEDTDFDEGDSSAA